MTNCQKKPLMLLKAEKKCAMKIRFSSVLQARWRCLAGVPWPPGSVPCSTALVVTSWQTSCLEAAPSTISNTTATSCWPQLSGEKILRTPLTFTGEEVLF